MATKVAHLCRRTWETQAEGGKGCDLPSYQLGLRTGPGREPGLALCVIVTYSWKAAGRKGPGGCWSVVADHESNCVQVAKKAKETWLVPAIGAGQCPSL